MAKQKKSVRRVPHSGTPRTFGDGQPAPAAPVEAGQAVAPRTNGTTVRPVAPGFRRRASTGSESRPQLPLSQEYGYVARDLRRLAMLGSVMVILMVVLGLIIH